MSSLFAPFLRRLRSCASNFEYPSSFVTYEELGSTPQRAVLFAKRRLFPPFYELITHFFAPPSWRRFGASLSNVTGSSIRRRWRTSLRFTPKQSGPWQVLSYSPFLKRSTCWAVSGPSSLAPHHTSGSPNGGPV